VSFPTKLFECGSAEKAFSACEGHVRIGIAIWIGFLYKNCVLMKKDLQTGCSLQNELST